MSVKFGASESLLNNIAALTVQGRKNRSWSQKDLAVRVDVGRSTIQRVEQAESGVSIGVILDILWVFGMSEKALNLFDPLQDTVGVALALDNMAGKQGGKQGLEFDDDF